MFVCLHFSCLFTISGNCKCNADGSLDTECNSHGVCNCKCNIVGLNCDKCAPGFYKFPLCERKYTTIHKNLIFYENLKKYICLPKTLACSCDEYGSVDDSCDENGQCSCKDDYGGLHCDLCMEGMFGFPNCEGKQKFIFYICYIFFLIFIFLI